MSIALLALLSIVIPSPRPPSVSAPTGPASLNAAAALETELRSGDVGRAVGALHNAPMAEPGVLGVIAGVLQQDRPRIRMAALDSLGRAGDALAYSELREHQARERSQERAVDERVELLRAIGRYGRADAVDLLIADLERPIDAELLRARLFGLANIPSRASADGVFYLLNCLTPEEIERSHADLHLALVRTTGVDHGLDFARWRAFWSARAPGFHPLQTPRPFSARQAKAWKRYWGK